VEDLRDIRIGEQRLQVRRVGMSLRHLDDVGGAVTVGHLHHAEPVAMRMKPHGLGIDRNGILVAGEIGQIAAMQADGHKRKPRVLGRFHETLASKLPGGERCARFPSAMGPAITRD
jgi:hypothetical protein